MVTWTRHRKVRWCIFASAVAVLLIYLGRSAHPLDAKSEDPTTFSPRLYEWTYSSHADLQVVGAQAMKIDCQARGTWAFLNYESNPLVALDIQEFTCNKKNLHASLRSTFLWKDMLGPAHGEMRPLVALARSLATQIDLGVETWPATDRGWKFVGHRPGGFIETQLSIQDKASRLLWTKNYNGPLLSKASSGLKTQVKILTTGSHMASLPLPFGLESLEASEVEENFMAQKKIGHSDIRIAIKLSSQTLALGAEQWPRLSLESPVANAPLSAEKRDLLRQQWQKFLAHPQEDLESSNQLYVSLKEAFRKDADFSASFVPVLSQLDVQDDAFKLLLGSLVYAGSKSALDAAVQAAREHRDDPDWQRAMVPTLGLAPRPSAASWQYLEDNRQNAADADVRNAAELAMASHYKNGYRSEQAEAFLQETRQRLAESSALEERLLLLDIIGNAADESILPQLKTWSAEADSKLRAAVAFAMRNMQSIESEALLLQLCKDSQSEVALAAAKALEYRQPTPQSLEILLNILGSSRLEAQQIALLETLYKLRSTELANRLSSLRSNLTLSAAVQERWEGVERDMLTPQSTN